MFSLKNNWWQSQLRTYHAHNSWPPHHLVVVVVVSSLSGGPSRTSPSPPSRPRAEPSVLSRPPHRWPPRRVAPPPEGGRPRSVPETERPGGERQRRAHADARAPPSKKPDVSSDRIGAASRCPRVGVNRSEGAFHVCATAGAARPGHTCRGCPRL